MVDQSIEDELMNDNLDEVAYDDAGWPHVAVNLARLGQVGDAGVRAHQHVHRVQRTLQEAPLRLRQVNAAQRRFRQVVMRHQGCKPSIDQSINQSIRQSGLQSIDRSSYHQSINQIAEK
jgi:hypothetical protein